MFATRRVCLSRQSILSGVPQTILPRPTLTGLLSSACQGAWSLMVDEPSRTSYEQLVKSNVIKDMVLSNASNGTILTYALFHELQNPLWANYNVNVEEFVEASGPALENFHETLGRLRNSLLDNLKEENAALEERMKQTDEEILDNLRGGNLTEALLGVNHWRQQAEADNKSLAATLSRMTTEPCFDALFYTSKLDALARVQGNMLYHDSVVNEVALLSARVSEVRRPTHDDGDEGEYNEFQATDDLNKDFPVGAQLDVLFEVTHTFKAAEVDVHDANAEANTGSTLSNNSNSSTDADVSTETDAHPPPARLSDDTDTNAATKGTDSNTNSNPAEDVLSITNLAVGIFEGWLHGGPQRQLKWKIALIREAFEFPQSAPVTRQ